IGEACSSSAFGKGARGAGAARSRRLVDRGGCSCARLAASHRAFTGEFCAGKDKNLLRETFAPRVITMRNLNCKRVSRNVSLFVAGDLSGDLDREIVNHLAICEECGRLAQEFRESNSLLTEACALPEFGAQFYDEIRNRVLEKITRDGVSSRRQFVHRWIYAAAFALMLAAFTAMFVRWRGAREAPQDLASTTGIAGNTASNQKQNLALSFQSKDLPPKSQRPSIPQKPARRMTFSRPTSNQFESARKFDVAPGGPQLSS